ncbi:MAG: [Atopobiaceae bacterium]|nr:[FeFe] hydrogenase H-cluster radical SAM maturase HydE [Atopobiaceae bacterium]
MYSHATKDTGFSNLADRLGNQAVRNDATKGTGAHEPVDRPKGRALPSDATNRATASPTAISNHTSRSNTTPGEAASTSTTRLGALAEKLAREHTLADDEYRALISGRTPELAKRLAELARVAREPIYGTRVFTRGLIEISNICKNDCLYCGIRRSNHNVKRYRLEPETIVACAREGHELGFRTIVLQGGEDGFYTDEVLAGIVEQIAAACPDSAITLSMGERSRTSYKRLFDAGATRYLLRHETATPQHYEQLHPANMRWERRMQCLRDLREIGYQVGAGFMVGSPYQTIDHLVAEMRFIERFKPEMCGIGPFIPHHDTPFAHEPAGTLELTLYLLSMIRLIHPHVLLPATTALGTIDPRGREKGMLAGANVVMPNLSPIAVRKNYELYDNKICMGEESAICRGCLARRMASVGHELVVDRGDFR